MIDCIAGYHLNPWTCGIAKFNAILARNLDVPVVGIGSPDLQLSAAAAVAQDVGVHARGRAGAGRVGGRARRRFELFLHAFDGTAVEQRLLAAAAKVYCGNRELSHELRPARPDIVELFCPGTLLNPQRFQQTEL